MRRFVLILVAIVLAPALTSGQWLKYPTDGLPRNKDGTLNRTAPTPRLPDGHPDLSGLWHAADPNRCRGRGGPFINCGVEIGGSPLGAIAGTGSAMVGATSMLLSMTLGTTIGQMYDGTVLPLVAGFAVLSLCSIVAAWWAEGAGNEAAVAGVSSVRGGRL